MASQEVPALTVGLVGKVTVPVTDAETADAVGSGSAHVFATPMLVLAVERAAVTALWPFLRPDDICLGTHVNVRHVAASPVGFAVTVTSRLVAISGRHLQFEVEARDEVELVAQGDFECFVGRKSELVDRLSRKAEKALSAKE